MMASSPVPQFLNPDDAPALMRALRFCVRLRGHRFLWLRHRRRPQAIIEASSQVEFYDDLLGCEPCQAGIITLPQPAIPADPGEAVNTIREATAAILQYDKFPVVLGGEHSISLGVYQALAGKYPALGVIQFDAHADLRKEYQGSPHSHACVMARIREHTTATLQLAFAVFRKKRPITSIRKIVP